MGSMSRRAGQARVRIGCWHGRQLGIRRYRQGQVGVKQGPGHGALLIAVGTSTNGMQQGSAQLEQVVPVASGCSVGYFHGDM